MVSEKSVRRSLGQVQIEALGCDPVTAGVVSSVSVTKSDIEVAVELGFPAEGIRQSLEAHLADAIQAGAPDYRVHVSVAWKVVPHRAQGDMPALDQVSNVIAVASGKGGVGKSTTAVNLALALAADGARVGILDADIYGPSQGIMLGVKSGTRPEVIEGRLFVPVSALGLQSMSMAYLADDTTPVVWRGPKASGALQQMMLQTRWRNLDYLLVDLPPGTGDVQLTLAQRVPVAGAVIVTTPQDIALLDARRAIEMFRKVDIPVLGIVENMAVHLCSNCGHADHVFGEGGGARIAAEYDTVMLGSLPLSRGIREQADSGLPTVARDPDGAEAMIYRQVARRLAGRLSLNRVGKRAFPQVVMRQE